MRLFFVIGLIIVSNILFGQRIVNKIDVNLESGGSGFFFGIGVGDAEIIPFLNEQDKNPILCIRDKKKIIVLTLDDDFSIQSKSETVIPSETELVGGIKRPDRLSLIYSTYRKKGFIVQDIYFDGSPSTEEVFNFPKKEKFITVITDNNQCHLITSIKNTSIVNIYSFDADNYTRKKEFLLEPIQLNGQKWPFYHIFNKSPVYISQNSPSAFQTTSSQFKMYLGEDDVIRMTLDNVLNYTKVVSLDLNTGKSQIKNYEKSVGNCEYASTNSLIHKNAIYILTICKSYLFLNMRDLNTGRELNQFSTQSDDEIYFRNSPIIQEGGGTIYSQDRKFEINDTKKFLYKTSKLRASLAIEEIGDNLQLTIGGFKTISDTSGGVGSYTPGISTPFGTTAGYYSPTNTSYQLNTWGKSTLFKMILNKKNLDHIEKVSVINGPFKRIREYEDELDVKAKVSTILKRGKSYYFIYYVKKNGLMNFVQFD